MAIRSYEELMDDQDFYCSECGELCEIYAESFDYSGTHCTFGKSGTHYTGVTLSKCCDADVLYHKPTGDDE